MKTDKRRGNYQRHNKITVPGIEAHRPHPAKVHKKYIIMNINNNDDNNIYIEAHCHETLEKQNKENVLKIVIGKTTWLPTKKQESE